MYSMRPGVLSIIALLFSLQPAMAEKSTHHHRRQAIQATAKGRHELLARVYLPGDSQSTVIYSTRAALHAYCVSATHVGEQVDLRDLLNAGLVVKVPNRVLVRVRSREPMDLDGVRLHLAEVEVREGYWKGRIGYVLWEDLVRA